MGVLSLVQGPSDLHQRPGGGTLDEVLHVLAPMGAVGPGQPLAGAVAHAAPPLVASR